MILNILAEAPAQLSITVGWVLFGVGVVGVLGIFRYFAWRISK